MLWKELCVCEIDRREVKKLAIVSNFMHACVGGLVWESIVLPYIRSVELLKILKDEQRLSV